MGSYQNNEKEGVIKMGENTKLLLSITGGAALGALICFVITKEHYEKIVEEELESMEAYYKAKYEVENVISEIKTEVVLSPDKPSLSEMAEKVRTDYKNYAEAYKPEEVQAIDDEDMLGPDETDIELTEEEKMLASYSLSLDEDYHESEDGPYVISAETFDETRVEWDKLTLFWYTEDGVLTDDQEGLVPDIESVIGNTALENFGMNPHEPDVVYARNPMLSVDYEICRVNDSYAESVLGFLPKEKKEGGGATWND